MPSQRAVNTGTTIGAPCNRVGVRRSAVVGPDTLIPQDRCTSPCLSRTLRQLVTSPWHTLDRAGQAYHHQGSFSFDHRGQEVRELHQNGGGEARNNQETAAAIERTEPRLEQRRRQQQQQLWMVPGEQCSTCWGRRCRGAASARGAAAVDAGGEDTRGAAAAWIEKVLPGGAAQQAGDTKPKRKSRAAKRKPTDAQLAVQQVYKRGSRPWNRIRRSRLSRGRRRWRRLLQSRRKRLRVYRIRSGRHGRMPGGEDLTSRLQSQAEREAKEVVAATQKYTRKRWKHRQQRWG